jgi:hypothetical protein
LSAHVSTGRHPFSDRDFAAKKTDCIFNRSSENISFLNSVTTIVPVLRRGFKSEAEIIAFRTVSSQ